jgi:serine/threonine protein kinase
MNNEQNLRALPLGEQISDYVIERILGQGGFGITYLASDVMLDKKVAIKEYYPREYAVREGTRVVRPTGSQEDRDTFKWGLTRFLDEARVLARFDHSNIIAVRRFFEANGTAYLVMDYCEGAPLDEYIKDSKTLIYIFSVISSGRKYDIITIKDKIANTIDVHFNISYIWLSNKYK